MYPSRKTIHRSAIACFALCSLALFVTGCNEFWPSRSSTPTLVSMPNETPTPVGGPQPNSNGAMDRANVQGTGVYSGSSISLAPRMLWKFRVDTVRSANTVYGRVGSTPVVANGLVYIGGDEYLYAVNVATGSAVWKFNTPGGGVNSAAVAGRLVYFASGDQELYAVDGLTGTERWRFSIKDRSLPWSAFSNPVVYGGLVYVGSERGALIAIDAISGQQVWHLQVPGGVARMPTVANGLVLFGTEIGNGTDIRSMSFYAVNAQTGAIVWRTHLEEGVGNASAVDDDTVYVSGYAAGLYALDIKSGQIKWQFKPRGIFLDTAPSVAYGTVYVTWGRGLYALDSASGRERWRYEGSEGFIVSPSIVGNIIYCPTSDASTNNNTKAPGVLYAIDAHTGNMVWKYPIAGDIGNNASIVDNVLYVKSDDGYLYAIR